MLSFSHQTHLMDPSPEVEWGAYAPRCAPGWGQNRLFLRISEEILTKNLLFCIRLIKNSIFSENGTIGYILISFSVKSYGLLN